MKPTLLIMAAGLGSRYGSLKQIDALGPSGETIIDYTVFDALRAGFGRVVFVIRRNIEADFKASFSHAFGGRIPVDYVLQELELLPEGYSLPEGREKPWGTGHAVWAAAGSIQEPFAVVNADDFYGADAFRALADFFRSLPQGAAGNYSLVGYPLANTLSEFGAVSRGICSVENGYTQQIVERKKIERTANGLRYVEDDGSEGPLREDEVTSMNTWGFTPDVFPLLEAEFRRFLDEQSQNLKAEFYISSFANTLLERGEASFQVLPTQAAWFGVTYKEDKAGSMEKLRALTEQGAYPSPLWG